ncbi:MAG: thiaminase II [Chloroflexi bacterium]|nr:thiaminase II [Chloroflexota bacterium]
MAKKTLGRFTEELWSDASDLWQAIQDHPFLRELQEGTLPIEKFRYYMIQDFHYMAGFGRTVAAALSKAQEDELARRLLPRVSTPVERPFHVKLFGLLEIDERHALEVEQSPTNLSYTNHLEVSAAMGGIGGAAAALLPCPWTYNELGASLRRPEHPIYDAWFESYASGLLETSTREWRRFVDEFAERGGSDAREMMRSVFMTSIRYEHKFWTMAYEMESWPLDSDDFREKSES